MVGGSVLVVSLNMAAGGSKTEGERMGEKQTPAFGGRDVVQWLVQGGTMECSQSGDLSEAR